MQTCEPGRLWLLDQLWPFSRHPRNPRIRTIGCPDRHPIHGVSLANGVGFQPPAVRDTTRTRGECRRLACRGHIVGGSLLADGWGGSGTDQKTLTPRFEVQNNLSLKVASRGRIRA